MAVKTGFGAVQQAMQEAAERSSSMGAGRAGYFKLATNERKIIRFLTDEVVTAQFAEGVMGKDGKKSGYIIPDPDNNLIAKLAPVGAWDGKLKTKTVGMAVELEERVLPPSPNDPPGTRPKVEYVDKVAIRQDGASERNFMVVLQAHGNFWDKVVGFHTVYHTICDRPYSVTKIGSMLATDYQIAPLDVPADDPLRDPAKMQEHYGYGRPWNKDDPQRFWWCPQTLDDWVADYGSERRIRFFVLGEREDGQPAGGQPAAPPQNGYVPQPGTPAQPDADFQALSARLTGQTVAGAPPAAPPVAPTPPAPPAAPTPPAAPPTAPAAPPPVPGSGPPPMQAPQIDPALQSDDPPPF